MAREGGQVRGCCACSHGPSLLQCAKRLLREARCAENMWAGVDTPSVVQPLVDLFVYCPLMTSYILIAIIPHMPY